MNVDGQRIRLERARKLMTLEALANLTSLSVKTLSRIEKRGAGSPESIKAVLQALNLSSDDVVPAALASKTDREIQRDLKLKEEMEKNLRFCINLKHQNPQKVIVIDADRKCAYPEGDTENQPGASPWFVAYVHELYHDGISLLLIPRQNGSVDSLGRWRTRPSSYKDGGSFILDCAGRIPFGNVVGVDYLGDNIYQDPKIYCHYIKGDPFTSYRFLREDAVTGYLEPLFAEYRDPGDPDYDKLPLAGDI